MKKSSEGRVVLNHSTHIPGLIPLLEKLCQKEGIQTVVPGVIGRARSHTPRLMLKVSVPTQGGFKVIARQGKTVQEVFVVTSLSLEQFKEAIDTLLKSQ